MNNEITFSGLAMRGVSADAAVLATMISTAIAADVLVAVKLVKKIVVAKTVGVTPT